MISLLSNRSLTLQYSMAMSISVLVMYWKLRSASRRGLVAVDMVLAFTVYAWRRKSCIMVETSVDWGRLNGNMEIPTAYTLAESL